MNLFEKSTTQAIPKKYAKKQAKKQENRMNPEEQEKKTGKQENRLASIPAKCNLNLKLKCCWTFRVISWVW